MHNIGLVPAAGAGVRAYPATNYVPKVMLEVGGKPIIQHNIEILRDKLGIRNIWVITGYMGDLIKDFLKDGSQFGVHVQYVDCEDPKVGLAHGILLAKDKLREDFVTILGDEVYINSNHEIIPTLWQSGYAAACGLMRTDDHNLIAKNYTVTIEGDRIVSLDEKPKAVKTDILGCGTYVFTPEIFAAIERTRPSTRSGKVELTDAIGTLAAEGKVVFPLFLKGEYHNVNSVEDYNYANYVYRDAFFDTFKIGLVIPAE